MHASGYLCISTYRHTLIFDSSKNFFLDTPLPPVLPLDGEDERSLRVLNGWQQRDEWLSIVRGCHRIAEHL